MRCLRPGCHRDGIPADATTCPGCGVYLLRLLQDVLPLGTLLDGGKYRIDYALGQGGFGITYRAMHTHLQTLVAIKELFPQELALRDARGQVLVATADQERYERTLERFLREGRVLARLDHPNVVRVTNLFRERGTAYLVMDLIPGHTLRQELEAAAGRGLEHARARQVVEQMVAALEAIHAAGVYHLDLKPENLLVREPDGQVVLVDFGAARQGLGQAPALRSRSVQPHTEAYAPPEVLAGRAVGPESDLFELAMVLHELLTGRCPPRAYDRLLDAGWTPDAGLSPAWRELLTPALALRREERPSSVREWWNAAPAAPWIAVLPELVEQGQVRRLGRGTIHQVLPMGGDRVLVIAGGGASLHALATGAVEWEIDCPATCGALAPGGTLLALAHDEVIHLWDLRTYQRIARLDGHIDTVWGVAFAPDGRTLALHCDDETVRLWEVATGRELRRLEGYAECVAFAPNGRTLASGNAETVRLWDVATGRELRRLAQDSGVNSVAFAPDGRTLASGGCVGTTVGTVRLWDVASGHEVRRLDEHTSRVWSVAFAPNGRTLASGGWDTVRLWDVASGRELRQLEEQGSGVNTVAFTADGRALATGSDGGTVRLWDVASGRELRRLDEHTSGVKSMALAADGRTLACGGDHGTVRFWDVASGYEVRRLERHSSRVHSVTFTLDGSTLASAGSDRMVRLWDVASGYEVRRLDGHFREVRDVAFAPDGRTLAAGGYVSPAFAEMRGAVQLWNVTTGRELRRLEHGSYVSGVTFAPDGHTLVSGGDTVRLWEVTAGRELRDLEGHERGVDSVAFAPDGSILASGGHDSTVRLWDVATGRELRRLEPHMGPIWGVAFAPDGRTLASGATGGVQLWEVASGRELRRLFGHAGAVTSVAFTPDGRSLASGSTDGVVRLWKWNR